jgi:hypothetical protein
MRVQCTCPYFPNVFCPILLSSLTLMFIYNQCFLCRTKSRDSSVAIALSYGLDDRGSMVRFSAGAGDFSLHHRVQNGSGAHPASYPMGIRVLSLGIKRPGCEADHSPPSSAEVKEWMELYLHFLNTPSWLGVQSKHRDNFTFTFYFFVVPNFSWDVDSYSAGQDIPWILWSPKVRSPVNVSPSLKPIPIQ